MTAGMLFYRVRVSSVTLQGGSVKRTSPAVTAMPSIASI